MATIKDIEIEDILIHLPFKTLHQVRCVSKHWHSKIMEQSFLLKKSQIVCKNISGWFFYRIYSKSQQKYDFIGLGEGSNNPTSQSVTFSVNQSIIFSQKQKQQYNSSSEGEAQILYSCNGLLLFQSMNLVCGVELGVKQEYNYWIVNPTTTKNIHIYPYPSLVNRPVKAAYLAFDPRKSEDYSVICIYDTKVKRLIDGFQILIYSSSCGQWTWWRYHDDDAELYDYFYSMYIYDRFELCSAVYWNGAINWVSFYGNGLYFNIDDKRFGELPMPEILVIQGMDKRMIKYFGESNDHLHLIINTFHEESRFNVYEMIDEKYSGWLVKYQVNMKAIIRRLGEISTIKDPTLILWSINVGIMDIVRKKEDKESFFVFIISRMIVFYNFTDGNMKIIYNVRENHPLGDNTLIEFPNSFRFVYSLISLPQP